MREYNVTIVEFTPKRLAGVKVRTSMQRASIDCPAIWETFSQRMGEISPEQCGGYYGASVMLSTQDFDYWATVEINPAAPVPAGMGSLDVPAGPYAKVTAPDLEKMSEAYMYMYSQWLKSRTDYTYRSDAPSLELYPPNWQMNDAFEIFLPLSKA